MVLFASHATVVTVTTSSPHHGLSCLSINHARYKLTINYELDPLDSELVLNLAIRVPES